MGEVFNERKKSFLKQLHGKQGEIRQSSVLVGNGYLQYMLSGWRSRYRL